MKFELPKLDYAYDALEPNIDAKTMEIHHSKHHNGYTNNLNNALDGSSLDGKTIDEICKSWKTKFSSSSMLSINKRIILQE